MDTKSLCWLVILCAGLLAWLYFDIKQSMQINYAWHTYLVNSTTGQKTRPSDIIDLGKVINLTETYLNSTNSIERLYDLEYNVNLENPFAIDQIYSSKRQLELSGWPVANQTKCARDLNWINEQIIKNPSYSLIRGHLGQELTQLMDSFGKPEAGFYSGIVTWLGSYKQCKTLRLKGGELKTRYCLARMRPKWWPKNETSNLKTRIRLGVCLPESCDTLSFAHQKTALDFLIKFDMNQFFRENLEFDSLFCLPDERSPIRRLPKSGRIYLYILGSWLLVVAVASILYEIIQRRQRNLIKMNKFCVENSKDTQEVDILKGLGISEIKRGSGVYYLSKQSGNSSKPPANLLTSSSEQLKGSVYFKILQALSIHYSLKTFKTDPFREQVRLQEQQNQLNEKGIVDRKVRVDLGSLSAIKFLMAIAVILGHSSYLASIYTRSLGNRVELNVNSWGHMVLSISRCVDTFFVYFGVLTAYTLLKKFSIEQLSKPVTWIGINLGILLRISPVFILVYWYSRSISPYTGNGPWWDYGVYRYSMKGNCMHEPWWKSILYFGCFGSPAVASCVLPAWFLVSYSQLSLIMPLITYLIYKLPSHLTRYLLVLFATILSSLQLALKMYRQTSFKEEAFTLYGGFLVDLVEKFESTGTMSTIGRVGCVALGCYAGYLLRMYELGKIRAWPNWIQSKLSVCIVMLLHVIIIFLPLIGHKYAQATNHITTMNEFLGSYLTVLIIWPTLNAMLLINVATVYNRIAVVRFLGHSFWHSANKLGLGIYLIHWELLFFALTSFEQGPSVGFISDIGKLWSFGVFFSILLSFLIHIAIEAPLSTLLMLVGQQFQPAKTPSKWSKSASFSSVPTKDNNKEQEKQAE